MYQNVDKADSIVTRLGDLLQNSLATEQKPFVSLKEEVQVMTNSLLRAALNCAFHEGTKSGFLKYLVNYLSVIIKTWFRTIRNYAQISFCTC
ncbi:MAG: hypothetical protein ACI9DO_003596 [Reinekea sp.]|jgi:hypothetical protein